ncbi:hypothetical protein LNP74_22040 [Klebsiella pneumoniae subsp. pneumoniae]|nr:hypothetical protein [Klebsiella pneumoniae subsp. pneumoniae]
MILSACRTSSMPAPEFAEVLKKHGITDPGKVVTTPLTVGFSMAKMACSRMHRVC